MLTKRKWAWYWTPSKLSSHPSHHFYPNKLCFLEISGQFTTENIENNKRSLHFKIHGRIKHTTTKWKLRESKSPKATVMLRFHRNKDYHIEKIWTQIILQLSNSTLFQTKFSYTNQTQKRGNEIIPFFRDQKSWTPPLQLPCFFVLSMCFLSSAFFFFYVLLDNLKITTNNKSK